MIERLTGRVVERKPPLLVLDVGGVGYGVQMPMTSFDNLPSDGEATVLTHMQVREDGWQLFGFTSETDRGLFRDLIRINGVGPRIALAVLSSMDGNTFMRYIAERATDRLTRVPGIGKKTAERVLLEMKERLGDALPEPGGVRVSTGGAVGEAVAALTALGYKTTEAKRLVAAADAPADAPVEDVIRAALRGGDKRQDR